VPAAIEGAALADAGVVALLGLFALWGWMRGALRQAGSLALLLGALALAGVASGRLEGVVGKVATLNVHDRCVVAWAATFVGTFVAASVVARFLSPFVGVFRTPRARLLGALLGLAKGVVVVTIGLYALLANASASPRAAVVDDLEHGFAAHRMRAVSRGLSRLLSLPDCVVREVAGVDARTR
jgi:membrane protein required for colicin V production